MSDLESATAPILKRMMHGKEPSVHLSPEDQTILARWAHKTALVADFVLRTREDDPIENPAIPKKHIVISTQVDFRPMMVVFGQLHMVTHRLRRLCVNGKWSSFSWT